MMHYLVVANQTAAGLELKRAMRERLREGLCRFTLVVPATHPRDHATWTEGSARELAKHRMAEALDSLRAAGMLVTGRVGDADPFLATSDALNYGDPDYFDGVIVSTFPRGISRWLRMDLAARIEREFGLPVLVVESERIAVAAGT